MERFLETQEYRVDQKNQSPTDIIFSDSIETTMPGLTLMELLIARLCLDEMILRRVGIFGSPKEVRKLVYSPSNVKCRWEKIEGVTAFLRWRN